ncbi:MAG: hypothetical protein ABSD46_05380 [Bacteroidota bacterium]
MNEIVKDMPSLIQLLQSKLEDTPIWAISIDGADGSGKTVLSSKLAITLDASHVEVDTFLERKKGSYIDYVKYGSLAETLVTLSSQNRRIIVDAVCVRWIMEHISFVPNLTIYVKRMSTMGWWADSHRFPDNESFEEYFSKEQVALQAMSKLDAKSTYVPEPIDKPDLSKDLFRYHQAVKPHLTSDIILEHCWRPNQALKLTE